MIDKCESMVLVAKTHEGLKMPTVVFNPKYEQDQLMSGHSKTRPICSRVCGTSACLRARKKEKCPGDPKSLNLITCATYRYVESGIYKHAAYTGGTIREIDL